MTESARCEYCNGKIARIVSFLPFNSKALGKLYVPNVEQYKCSQCGNTLISLKETDKISKYIKEKEQDAINKLPIGEFVSLNTAADMLGISKQAFSKNHRIKRGLIYSVPIDGKKFYYKKSVEEFKKTGKDGRILISFKSTEVFKQKFVHTTYQKPSPLYNWSDNFKPDVVTMRNPKEIYIQCVGLKPEDMFIAGSQASVTELCYMFGGKEPENARKIR